MDIRLVLCMCRWTADGNVEGDGKYAATAFGTPPPEAQPREQTGTSRPRRAHAGPSRTRRPKKGQTAQKADGPYDPDTARRARRPKQVRPDLATKRIKIKHMCHLVITFRSMRIRSNFKHRTRSTKNPSPQEAKSLNRDAVVCPRTQIRTASKQKRRFLAK